MYDVSKDLLVDQQQALHRLKGGKCCKGASKVVVPRSNSCALRTAGPCRCRCRCRCRWEAGESKLCRDEAG